MKKLLLCFLIPIISFSQTNDEVILKQMYSTSLTQSSSYGWLDYLSNKIGSRLSGSTGAEKAVIYTKSELEKLGLDKVYLQEVMVPKWVRGEKETAYILDNKKKTVVSICALGGSIATPKNGILAEVIEVQGIDDLEKLGVEKIKGKIVFFNLPMDAEFIETFNAYSKCGNQRWEGAKKASNYGAVAVIVRSLSLRLDDFPHTGSTNYGDIPKEKYIPAAAISTNGAELLSKMLKENNGLKFYFKQSCQQLDDVLSYNVIGEITGSTNPNEIMIVSGHLDSWDLGDGSHDDGAGSVQSMGVLEIFKKMNYIPKHTIRVVLFMNEENGLRGGKKYAEIAELNKDNHVFAMESDSGGFSPRGFSFDCDEANFNKAVSWKNLFEPYLIHSFVKGHGGSDIGPLTAKKLVKVGLNPDSQRYFDYHHAANDTFDAVNKRELELGTATMASILYLFDQYGID